MMAKRTSCFMDGKTELCAANPDDRTPMARRPCGPPAVLDREGGGCDKLPPSREPRASRGGRASKEDSNVTVGRAQRLGGLSVGTLRPSDEVCPCVTAGPGQRKHS